MRGIPRPAEKLYRSRQALVLPRSFSAIETLKCYRDSSVLLRIFGATEELYRYRELVFVVKGILVIKWEHINSSHPLDDKRSLPKKHNMIKKNMIKKNIFMIIHQTS
jgi:hypothetical protein